MRARKSIAVILLASLCYSATSFAGRKLTFKGRIAAYRPADKVGQVVSFVINRELFLFRTEDGKLLKLVYRHNGFSDIVGSVLSGSANILISARRDHSCDETLGAFEANAPDIPLMEDGKKFGSIQRLVFSASVPLPPQTYRMKCYVLQRWSALK